MSEEWMDRILPHLRACQVEAIDAIDKYMEKDETKPMLVCLPTGSGKTGIIAIIAQRCARGSVLIVSPRRAVANQLLHQVGGAFFNNLLGELPKGLTPTNGTLTDSASASITVSTFQKLLTLSTEELSVLAKNTELVIIDEGHSEPAPAWSAVSRQFVAKKVIFTATPYRNDLLRFDIDTSSAFIYTFERAVRDKILEEPTFTTLDSAGVAAHVHQVLAADDESICLIKCRSFDEIEHYFFELEKHGIKASAIHDRYRGSLVDDRSRLSHVPDSQQLAGYRAIIYQHKLDEGIDLPSAKTIFLTYPVTSGRELVQTIGRVVRKWRGRPAQVVDCSDGSNQSMWLNYRKFDAGLSTTGQWMQFLMSLEPARIIRAYVEQFPKMTYFDGGFRNTFDFDNIQPERDITIPRASFCFLEVQRGFSIERLIDALYWRAHENGSLVRSIEWEELKILVTISFSNSRFLKESVFFEPTIDLIVARTVAEKLAIFDSRTIDHSHDNDLRTDSAVKSSELLSLGSRGSFLRTHEAHARALGTATRRAERISAAGNLDSMTGGQANSLYALSSVRIDNLDAQLDPISSYYLGVGTGRVADQRQKDLTLPEISRWLDDISSAMNSSATLGNAYLNSFAQPINYKPAGLPSAIIADIGDGESPPVFLVGGAKKIEVGSDFFYLEQIGGPTSDRFQGHSMSVRCEFDATADKFHFYALQDIVRIHDGSRLEDILNASPVKAMFPHAVTYIRPNYYRVVLPYQRGMAFDESPMCKVITGLSELKRTHLKEKGKIKNGSYYRTTADRFDEQSVFNLIDRLRQKPEAGESQGLTTMRRALAGLDILFCTDMGTEPADFIASTPDKICFIHVKCGSTSRPRASAGALAEVGGQAFKNIHHLAASSPIEFANRGRLEQSWPSGIAKHRLKERVRMIGGLSVSEYRQTNGHRTSSDLVGEIMTTINNRLRSALCQKEIWLIAGNSFSLSRFRLEMDHPTLLSEEAIQAFQLLDAWNSEADQYDIKLRVFTSP